MGLHEDLQDTLLRHWAMLGLKEVCGLTPATSSKVMHAEEDACADLEQVYGCMFAPTCNNADCNQIAIISAVSKLLTVALHLSDKFAPYSCSALHLAGSAMC